MKSYIVIQRCVFLLLLFAFPETEGFLKSTEYKNHLFGLLDNRDSQLSSDSDWTDVGQGWDLHFQQAPQTELDTGVSDVR